MNTILRLFPYAVAAILGIATAASAATHVREIDREFSASQFEKLTVNVNTGSIHATTGNDAVIRIEIDLTSEVDSAAKANELFDKTEVLFEERGKDLVVVVKRPPGKGFFSFFRGNRSQVNANVKVFVPRNFDSRMDTGSGSIEADGLTGNIILDTGSGSIKGNNLTGEIIADTGSGNVMLTNIEGNLNADTGSGSIDISGLNGELVADTGSGNVSASGNIHRFNVDTGSGSVNIQSLAVPKDRCTADTGSGGIQVQIPQPSGFNLYANIGSGHIECAFPMKDVLQKRHSLKAVANNGGPEIRLNTGSGDVIVQPNP